jgi:nucleotide-binding universal stress UspA family protein
VSAASVAAVPAGSIVVGVDGSEHAQRALGWAVEQAAVMHRPLALVQCAPHAEAPGILTAAARTVEFLDDGVGFTVHRVDDDPRDVLGELANDAALVVLGSRGRGSVRTALLGSVSASVARAAACPVVVCRPAHAGTGDARRPHVVVGSDGSPQAGPVLEFAFEQASLHGWPLTVMHCFWDVTAATVGRGVVATRAEDGLDDLRLLLAESVAGLAEKYPDVVVTRELARGLVDECLAGRSSGASLQVVGRSHPHGLDRLLYTSCAIAVLERADTTVAVVPEADGGSSPAPRRQT